MPHITNPFSLSLVIPSYNRGSLIEETINAALAQHEPFNEIIVVDDGSTDDTIDRLTGFGDRITVIRSRNRGVQQARNTGVNACSTQFVALCDSDDLLAPDFSATMRRVIQERPAVDIWYANFTQFSGDMVKPDKLSMAPDGFLDGGEQGDGFCVDIPDLYERVLHYQPFFPSGSVFSKTFYQAIGGYDTRFKGVGSEDFEFLLRAIVSGQLGYVTQPVLAIRKHDGNDSRDNLRSLNGEAEILEFALAQHPGAGRYRSSIIASVDKRRRDAFDIAYARGDFSAARDTASHFSTPPTDSNFRIKKAISSFPAIVRDVAWRLTQAVH